MGRNCIVKVCRNWKGKSDSTVHAFPNTEGKKVLRKLWIQKAVSESDRHEKILDNYGVCSRHFQTSDYKQTSIRKGLKDTAVPSIELVDPSKIDDAIVPDVIYANTNTNMDLDDEVSMFAEDYGYKENAALSDTPGDASRTAKILKEKLETTQERVLKKESLIEKLRRRNRYLEDKVNKIDETSFISKSTIEKVFSKGQIRVLTEDYGNYIHWDDTDISKALALYSISSKAYCYLRDVCKHPLPSISTLKRQLLKVELAPEKPIFCVMNLLQAEFMDATEMQKMCILALDEVAIDPKYCYDSHADRVYGGKDNCCVISIRGLFYKYKQVIQFNWNDKLDKNQLLEIIESLHGVGLKVCGLVTDMGTKNQGLWRDLEIGKVEKGVIGKTWFNHPVTNERIWTFADFPHLLKLLRNHLIDSGIYLEDGSVLDKSLIENLLNIQKGEFRLTSKLSHRHIYLRGKQRQHVRSAFQLFSNKVSKAIRFLLPSRTSEALFIKLINDFSDIMNTRVSSPHHNPYQAAYGQNLPEQDALLSEVYERLSNVRIGKRKTKTYAPFQKGMLMSIKSLQGLFIDMKRRVGCNYIMTSHLNQDYLENIFSQIRGLGGFKNNPTALDIIHRLKKLVCSWSSQTPTTSPVKEDALDAMISSRLLSLLSKLSEKVNNQAHLLTEDILEDLTEINWTPTIIQLEPEDFTIQKKSDEGGTEYLAGYVAKHFMEVHPELSKQGAEEFRTPFWVGFLSNNGLVEPSLAWHALFKKFDEIFGVFHPFDGINNKSGVVKYLVGLLKRNFKEVNEAIIKFFVKLRVSIRIKHLNLLLEDVKYKKQEFKRIAYKQSSFRSEENSNIENNQEDIDINEADLDLIEEVVENLCS